MKLTRNAGVDNDVASLWVNPVLGGTETPALISNSTTSDPATLDNIALRQTTTTPVVRIGNILVGTTWASVTPSSGFAVSSFTPASGRVGDTVVITGTGFSGVNSVSFGGVQALTYTVDSSTQISATVPSGALSGAISVTATAGTSSSSASFNVLVPVITSLSPDAGVADIAVSIAGTNFTPLTSVTFAGSGGSIPVTPSASSDTNMFVTVPAGAVSGPVTITTPSGSGSANFRMIAPIAVPYGPENFTNGFGQWFSVNAAGSSNWTIVTNAFGGGSTTGGPTNSWAQINGFGSDVRADDWLVVGPIDFSTSSNPVATFDTLTRFAFAGATPPGVNELSFKVSTNYTGIGSPATNGTWATVPFTKPSADLTVTPSGFVFVPAAAGLSNVWFAFHYQAGGTTNNTALWQVDNITFSNSTRVPLGLGLPPTITEGASNVAATVFAAGTNLASPLDVTIASSDAAELRIKATTNDVAATSAVVTIPAGTNSATFFLDATRDFTPDTNKTVAITATTTNSDFQNGSGTTVVNNVDFPSTDIGSSGYVANFSGMGAGGTNGPLPAGWAVASTAGPTFTNFSTGLWGSSSAGAGVVTTNGILGYQHTGSTGTNSLILTLKNTTGSAISALTISYNGRVARANEGRSPVFTVFVDGQVVPSLAYSTSFGDNVLTRTSLQGLNIADQATFTIVWNSDRGAGSGSSKQIGLSDVSVQLGFTPFPPSLLGITVFSEYVYDTTVEVASQVTGDGGSTVTQSGFVYSLASVTNSPAIGGEGVAQVPWDSPGIGLFGAQLGELQPLTTYAVRAYAINAIGTNYSVAATFTTTPPNPEFAGLYTQNFNGFTNASSFPAGWKCFSSSNVNSYAGDWSSASTTGGFYGTTNEPGILGYQHTTTTGVLQNRLTLKNLTGSTLTNLFISYLGMVTQTQQVRFPAWAVTGDDGNGAVEIPELAYSTSVGTNSTRVGQWTNFSVAPGESFTISWSSDRGENTNTGSSRRIGMGFVQIATSMQNIVTNAPVVTSTNVLTTSVGEPTSYQITATGGATGFWATNLPGGLALNKTNGLISGSVTNTNRSGSLIGLVAYNAFGAGESAATLTVARGTPTLSILPSASSITNGQALSNSILTGGSASVPGAFAWSFPTTVPAVGASSQQVTFTPTDTNNYNTATGSVSVTVIATGETFANWAQGAPLNTANLLLYSIGGASSPTATNGTAMSNAVTSSNLSITAIVRTNDPNLSVVGQAVTDLTTGPWSTNNVTMQPGDQTGVGQGLQRQIWSTPRNSDSKKFLRLQTTLSNQ